MSIRALVTIVELDELLEVPQGHFIIEHTTVLSNEYFVAGFSFGRYRGLKHKRVLPISIYGAIVFNSDGDFSFHIRPSPLDTVVRLSGHGGGVSF